MRTTRMIMIAELDEAKLETMRIDGLDRCVYCDNPAAYHVSWSLRDEHGDFNNNGTSVCLRHGDDITKGVVAAIKKVTLMGAN